MAHALCAVVLSKVHQAHLQTGSFSCINDPDFSGLPTYLFFPLSESLLIFLKHKYISSQDIKNVNVLFPEMFISFCGFTGGKEKLARVLRNIYACELKCC